jgi:hypothetical protein
MGSYTHDEMIAYVKFRLGQRTDLSSVDGEDFYSLWVNSAYKELASKNSIFGIKGLRSKVYFPELETADTSQSTVDGTAYIDVPTGALIIREVEDTTNDRLLERISWGEYKSYAGRADTDAEGQPTQCVRRGSYIYLYPTPDDTYAMTIDYRKKITVNISGSSTTDIGAEWDEPIVQLATYKGLMWMGEFDKSQPVKAEFMETIADILGVYFQDEVGRESYMHLSPAYKE